MTVLFQDGFEGIEKQNPVFKHDFEDNLLTSYTHVVGSVSITTDSPITGTRSLKVLNPGGYDQHYYVNKFVSDRSEAYMRCKIKIGSITGVNGTYLAGIEYQDMIIDLATLMLDGVNNKFYLEWQDNDGGTHTITTAITAVPGQVYTIELHSKLGHGNGVAELWIDGNLEASNTSIYNDNYFVQCLFAGVWYNEASTYFGEVIYDDFVIDSSYIGLLEGNFNAWDSVSGNNGTWVVQGSLVHQGSYAAKLSLPAVVSPSATLVHSISSANSRYMMAAIRLTALPASGHSITCGPYLANSSYWSLAAIGIRNDGGILSWYLGYDAEHVITYTPSSIDINRWYIIKVRCTVAVEGHVEAWIDGLSVMSKDFDNTATGSIEYSLIDFSADNAYAADLYVDGAVLSDVDIDLPTGILPVQGPVFATAEGNADDMAFDLPVTLNATPVVGNTLIATFSLSGGNTDNGKIDNITQSGVSWTKAESGGEFTTGTSEIWVGKVISTPSKTVTASVAWVNNGNVVAILGVVEYSGIASINYVDKIATADAEANPVNTGTTATTTVPNELWIGVAGCLTPTSCTLSNPTNGFILTNSPVIQFTSSGQGYQIQGLLTKIVSSVGTAETHVTSSTASWMFGSGCIITLKAIVAFTITSVSNSPSSVQRSGSATSTLRCDFTDPNDLDASGYTCRLFAVSPSSVLYGPYIGIVTKDSTGTYHAAYDWNPDDNVELGAYTVKAEVYRN